MFRSAPQLLLIVLFLGLLLMREARQPPLADVEETFVSWLAANSSGRQAAAPLALVEINDDSLREHPWPWSALDYALFLDGALQFRPAVAAVEPVLAWNERAFSPDQALKQPQFEKILHDGILRTPKLLLGAKLGFPEDPDVIPPLQPMPVLRRAEGAVDAIPEFTVVEAEPGEDIRLSAALGFTNVPGEQAIVRRAPLLFRYRGELVPSFVLQALTMWYGLTPDDIRVRPGIAVELGNVLSIPIDRAGGMLVDWRVPYARAGYDDFLLSVEQMEAHHAPMVAPETIRNKVVILARTDEKGRTLALPSGGRGSAGELFAAALATAETNAFVHPAGWVGDLAVLALALGLSGLLAARPKFYAIPWTLGFLAAYLLGCLLLFEGCRVVMPLTPMLGLFAFVALFRLAAPAPRVTPG